jgi:hypothetical protein
MKRNETGGTLALVAVCAIVIVIIGVAFFFLSKIWGGGNELRHATDSGNLNVAKTAIRRPTIDAATLTGIQKNNFSLLGDESQPPIPGRPINLLSYNRAVGHTLLVTLNANDEGTAAAYANRDNLKQALQGAGASLGANLAGQLRAGTGILTKFDETAAQNNVKMFGHGGSGVSHITADYKVAFIDQQPVLGDSDNSSQATNLVIPPSIRNIPNFIPADMISKKRMPGALGTTDFVRGYYSNSAAGVVGVPVYPGDQPHLLSDREFAGNLAFAIGGVNVPPNGFQSRGDSLEMKTQIQARSTSSAKVGSLNNTFPLNFKVGYIEAINGPATRPAAIVLNGNFGSLNNVLAQELGNGGIALASNTFSTDRGGMEQFSKYHFYNDNPDSLARDGGNNPRPPNIQAYKTTDGSPASPSDLDNMPYLADNATPKNYQGLDAVQCDDRNVHPGGDPNCRQQWRGPGNPGNFDRAYHNPPSYSTPGSVGNLIAAECAKCKLQMEFNNDPATVNLGDSCNGGPFGAGTPPEEQGTGLRLFPISPPRNGQDLPSAAPQACKVTTEGNIRQLFEQTAPGSFDLVFGTATSTSPQTLFNRIRQLNPNPNADLDYNTIKNFVANGPYNHPSGIQGMPVGSHAYIYYPDPPNPNGMPNFDYNIPPGKSVVGVNSPPEIPDGNYYPNPSGPFSTGPYGLLTGDPVPSIGMVNPEHDMGIHDQLYRGGPNGSSLMAVDYAGWRPSSGFNNIVGRIQFRQVATGAASGFDEPD